MQAETVFQIALPSKPITCSIVAALNPDEALTRDMPLSGIDPALKLFQTVPEAYVTVADMLSRRIGLPGITGYRTVF